MRRLIIIVEGQTEEEFVKEVLTPYFVENEIYSVTPIKIATSKVAKGGFVNYAHLKNDAIKYLREPDTLVTMFVDFFRIPTSIPSYLDCLQRNATIDDKIDCLEQAVADDINNSNFIPYIQKYEFEALLFSSNRGFEELFDERYYTQTEEIVNDYENPEEINTGAETSPSKRILNIISNYEKVVDGNMIAIAIGMDTILERCNRFNSWIMNLLSIMSKE
jgi:hypothetical protein